MQDIHPKHVCNPTETRRENSLSVRETRRRHVCTIKLWKQPPQPTHHRVSGQPPVAKLRRGRRRGGGVGGGGGGGTLAMGSVVESLQAAVNCARYV